MTTDPTTTPLEAPLDRYITESGRAATLRTAALGETNPDERRRLNEQADAALAEAARYSHALLDGRGGDSASTSSGASTGRHGAARGTP